MRLRTKILAGAAVPAAAAVAILASTAGPAAAQTAQLMTYHQPAQAVAQGRVELGDPAQEADFLALQGFGHNRGYIQYTNFTYAEPGSGVWAPANQADQLTFTVGTSTYVHTLNSGLELVALPHDGVAFSGTGQYPAEPAAAQDAWTIKGTVEGIRVHAVITYANGYVVTLDGTIASNGSASGTAVDSNKTDLDWSLPAGSFQTVLHYQAPVKSDSISVRTRNAVFSFVIPSSVPGLAGTPVTVQVHGGSSPTWSHEVTGSAPTAYPVTGGFIQVTR